MTQPLNLPKKVPLLPGFQFSDPFKQNFHKTQQFAFVNKTHQEKENYVKEPLDYDLLASMKHNEPPNLTYGTKKEPINDYIPKIPPPWLKYDRQVLRFEGYFQEHVVENKHENYRIRKCEIYYYLTDGTIYVTEPKIENSGIPQGVFIKRQKIPKDVKNPTEFYSWEDFKIATTMNFYERYFRVVDCDEFTRKFYADNKITLDKPEAIPIDNFEYQKSLKDLKIQPPDTKEYKEYFEVKLGGGHPNNGLAKYIANDRKVLSFEILWDDKSLEGGINRYTLNFFLADDTVEVKEENKPNSGKDPFPLLLRRSKLPKIPLMTHYPGMSLKKEEFYGPKDLMIGNIVRVFSRDCLIYDCDEFTKYWYKNTLGIDQIPLQLKGEKPKKYYQPLPPYNGFGSEEDSLGSVFALMPKPPRKDLVKMFTQDQNILRYEARLISQNKEDNTRTFIISFFCGDDTIQVYEFAERNSGIWTGKFLERSKHKHPITNKYYDEKDFVLGDTIVLRNYKFQLLRADEFTVKYMISKPDVFPGANIDGVLERLRQAAKDFKNHEEYAIRLFKHLDKNGNGSIEYQELYEGLKSLGIYLTPQQQYTMMRRFDENGDFKLSIEELLHGLYDLKK